MAVFQFYPVPANVACTTASLTAASSAAIALGKNTVFAINGDDDLFIKFGVNSSMSAASTSDFRIPANQTLYFDMGGKFTHVRVYCAGTGKKYYIQPLARTS